MTSIPETLLRRKPRIRSATYTVAEREIMDKHKDLYKQQTTRADRAEIFRDKILVDMYKYWKTHGFLPHDDEETRLRIRVLPSLPLIYKCRTYINKIETRVMVFQQLETNCYPRSRCESLDSVHRDRRSMERESYSCRRRNQRNVGY
jgi:hypothetical protein